VFEYACPHCGEQLSFPQELAGQTGRCRKCGRIVTMPTLSDRQAPLARPSRKREDPIMSVPLASTKPLPKSISRLGILTLVFALLAFFTCGLTVVPAVVCGISAFIMARRAACRVPTLVILGLLLTYPWLVLPLSWLRHHVDPDSGPLPHTLALDKAGYPAATRVRGLTRGDVREGTQSLGHSVVPQGMGLTAGTTVAFLTKGSASALSAVSGVAVAGSVSLFISYYASLDRYVCAELDKQLHTNPEITQAEWDAIHLAISGEAKDWARTRAVKQALWDMLLQVVPVCLVGMLARRAKAALHARKRG